MFPTKPCKAKTKTGQPCKLKRYRMERYCKRHLDDDEEGFLFQPVKKVPASERCIFGCPPKAKDPPPTPRVYAASQVTSALASSLATPLIGIVLDYFEGFTEVSRHMNRTVFVGSGPDIQVTDRAFARRMSNGSVTTWGSARDGGNSSSVQSKLKIVKAICGTSGAFAAIAGDDNKVICWGKPDCGGDCSAVKSELTQVEGICGSARAFAALKSDGTVVTWGDKEYGGDSSSAQSRLKGVKAIYSTQGAFAAVLHDGTVETWGRDGDGGVVPPLVKERLTQVQCISGAYHAFAALLSDGTVETWGRRISGDDVSKPKGLTEVVLICAADFGFAALKKDGTVIFWGFEFDGIKLQRAQEPVVAICASGSQFAVLRGDGSVVTRGDGDQPPREIAPHVRDVVAVCGNDVSFAAREETALLCRGETKIMSSTVRLRSSKGLSLSAPLRVPSRL